MNDRKTVQPRKRVPSSSLKGSACSQLSRKGWLPFFMSCHLFWTSALTPSGTTSSRCAGSHRRQGRPHKHEFYSPPSFCGALLDFYRGRVEAVPFPCRPSSRTCSYTRNYRSQRCLACCEANLSSCDCNESRTRVQTPEGFEDTEALSHCCATGLIGSILFDKTSAHHPTAVSGDDADKNVDEQVRRLRCGKRCERAFQSKPSIPGIYATEPVSILRGAPSIDRCPPVTATKLHAMTPRFLRKSQVDPIERTGKHALFFIFVISLSLPPLPLPCSVR